MDFMKISQKVMTVNLVRLNVVHVLNKKIIVKVVQLLLQEMIIAHQIVIVYLDFMKIIHKNVPYAIYSVLHAKIKQMNVSSAKA
jgi:hypothetical protein